MSEDMSKYRDAFLGEAKEHVSSMEKALLKLEKEPARADSLNAVFHAAHTLKSMAATMEYDQMATLCHAIEDVLDAIRNGKVGPDRCIDQLLECLDIIRQSLQKIAADGQELDTTEAAKGLGTLVRQGRIVKSRPNETIQAEAPKVESIAVKVEQLDLLMNLAEELLISRMTLDSIKEELQNPGLTAVVDTFSRQLSDLQYIVMQSRLVPIGFVFERFPRMVRDLARSQHKQVNLELNGADIELDRAVIDEIGESLVHLLRNAIDHGIETPEERRKAGKCAQATITITARRSKSFVTIEVTDDGRGLNLEDIRNAAAKKQVLSPQATTEELIQSIFFGVSTTENITTVSGRGFGLNIVKNKIESLGGAARVDFQPNQGTTFTLEIPLTLAIIKALLVEVGSKVYAIPLSAIERLITVDKGDIRGMMGHEAIVVNDEDIPVVRLNTLFDMPSLGLRGHPMVIVRKGRQRLVLAVDAFLTTQEIVVKPLNKLVRESRYFSGSTIIGSGEVVLILDMANLMLTRKSHRHEDLADIASVN